MQAWVSGRQSKHDDFLETRSHSSQLERPHEAISTPSQAYMTCKISVARTAWSISAARISISADAVKRGRGAPSVWHKWCPFSQVPEVASPSRALLVYRTLPLVAPAASARASNCADGGNSSVARAEHAHQPAATRIGRGRDTRPAPHTNKRFLSFKTRSVSEIKYVFYDCKKADKMVLVTNLLCPVFFKSL